MAIEASYCGPVGVGVRQEPGAMAQHLAFGMGKRGIDPRIRIKTLPLSSEFRSDQPDRGQLDVIEPTR